MRPIIMSIRWYHSVFDFSMLEAKPAHLISLTITRPTDGHVADMIEVAALIKEMATQGEGNGSRSFCGPEEV